MGCVNKGSQNSYLIDEQCVPSQIVELCAGDRRWKDALDIRTMIQGIAYPTVRKFDRREFVSIGRVWRHNQQYGRRWKGAKF